MSRIGLSIVTILSLLSMTRAQATTPVPVGIYGGDYANLTVEKDKMTLELNCSQGEFGLPQEKNSQPYDFIATGYLINKSTPNVKTVVVMDGVFQDGGSIRLNLGEVVSFYKIKDLGFVTVHAGVAKKKLPVCSY